MTATALTAAEAGLVSCETCSLLSRPAGGALPEYCPRCGGELAQRHHQSIQYTWALVIAAAICYIPANVLPVLTTNLLISALSVSAAIFLILELDQPFDGLIRMSSGPLRRALAQLGR